MPILTFDALFNPLLQALNLAGSGTNADLADETAKILALSDEQFGEQTSIGQPCIAYKLLWAPPFIGLSLLFLAPISDAQQPDKTEETGGLTRYYSEFFLAANWHVECTRSRRLTHGLSNHCVLAETTGKKTASGTYDTKDAAPVITVSWTEADGRPFVLIETGYQVRNRTVVSLWIGDQDFNQLYVGGIGRADWRNEDAREIVKLFISKNSAKYSYYDGAGRQQSGTQSLIGFTKAWDFAVRFIGVDPLVTADPVSAVNVEPSTRCMHLLKASRP